MGDNVDIPDPRRNIYDVSVAMVISHIPWQLSKAKMDREDPPCLTGGKAKFHFFHEIVYMKYCHKELSRRLKFGEINRVDFLSASLYFRNFFFSKMGKQAFR